MEITRRIAAERMVISISARVNETFASGPHLDPDAFIRLEWARDASLDISMHEATLLRGYIADAIAEFERFTGDTKEKKNTEQKRGTTNGI